MAQTLLFTDVAEKYKQTKLALSEVNLDNKKVIG